MKRLIIAVVAVAAALSLSSCKDDFADNYPVVFAHRGCWLGDVQTQGKVTEYYVPENSLDGVRTAARFGYPSIELDVRWTLDSMLVCMHDGTINRTMRNAADQSPIEMPVAVSKTSFDELRDKYALASVDPEMRRPIPALIEVLKECQACGIKPLMHCDIAEGYDMAVKLLGQEFIAFGTEFDTFVHVREIAPDCLILFDAGDELDKRGLEPTPDNIKSILAEIGGNVGTSSMGMGITEPEMIDALHLAGYPVQSSIYPTPREAVAVRNGADILLSDFCWRPSKGMKAQKKVTLVAKRTDSSDGFAIASFDQCELGALTITLKGEGSCTLTVEEQAATGAVETRTYEFASDGVSPVIERLSYRFWRTGVTVRLHADEGSSFKLLASQYSL